MSSSLTPGLQTHLDAIDQAIHEAVSGQIPAIIAALSARIAAAAARMMTESSAGADSSDPPDSNLSAPEAARRLGVSPAWLYKNASRLPFTVRIGRRLLFSGRGLERWNRRQQGP